MAHQLTKIRQGTPEDFEAVLDLVKELAAFEKASHEVTASINHYQRDFEDGWFEVLVAEQNHTIVGIALGHRAYSTWKGRMFYLDDLVVKEVYRGQGIGAMLFEAMHDLARQHGANLLKWQVLSWNEPALRFYEKYSARIETDWWNGKILLEKGH